VNGNRRKEIGGRKTENRVEYCNINLIIQIITTYFRIEGGWDSPIGVRGAGGKESDKNIMIFKIPFVPFELDFECLGG
jgi:hypothetical protein